MFKANPRFSGALWKLSFQQFKVSNVVLSLQQPTVASEHQSQGHGAVDVAAAVVSDAVG